MKSFNLIKPFLSLYNVQKLTYNNVEYQKNHRGGTLVCLVCHVTPFPHYCAGSTSSSHAVIFRHCQSMSSTLSCLIIDCCNDLCSSLTRLQSTRRSLVAHRVNSITTSSVSVCSHRYSATLTCSGCSTLTIWRSCTTIRLPLCSINSYRAGLLPAVVKSSDFFVSLIRTIMKRCIRQLERAARRAEPSAAAKVTAAWYATCRSCVDPHQRKRESFRLE